LLAAARGDPETARRHFGEARRLFQQLAQVDAVASIDLSAAKTERDAGNSAEAKRLAGEAAAIYPDTPGNVFSFRGESLLARLAVDAGRLDEAARRLEALGTDAEHRPGVADRIAFLGARASLARAQRRFEEARLDLQTAIAAARSAWLKLDELDLRLELASTELDAGKREAAAAGARAVAEEAASLGFQGVESRARRLGLF
jgi:hypothetical protein